MKPLFVLAGGFGTRLRSVVSDVPKPLAPVCGEPFLVHLVRHWVSQGVDDFIFLLHYEAGQINECLSSLNKLPKYKDLRFRFIKEDAPLGTGGAINNALQYLCPSNGFLVANADTWLGGGVVDLASMNGPALAAVRVEANERYGALDLEGDLVREFKEKIGSCGSGYVNSGLYHLLPNVFEGFELGSCFSIENDEFPLLIRDKCLSAVRLERDFIDIGIPDDYARFCGWFESERIL